MQRDPDGTRDGTRDGVRDGGRDGAGYNDPARARPATEDRLATERPLAAERPVAAEQRLTDPPQARQIEPNRVDVERRADSDRRVADHPVEVDRREADRRDASRAAAAAARERRIYILGRVTQGVDYLFYLLYGLLGIRFVLALLGASEQAGFVQFVNGLTQPFYGPFAGIVARPSVNGGFLDFPLLIALLAYALLHMAIRGLIRLMAGTATAP
jgi:uncharacterized protein YggT (Ycf19 family)